MGGQWHMATKTPTSKGFLYRIMDFHRAVQIFESKELYFAHPSTWDDPYEKFIKHPRSHALFAQCWTHAYSSDAMWRIYSPHGLGVRLSVHQDKLVAAGREFAKSHDYKWRGRDVEYFKLAEFKEKARELGADLKAKFDVQRAADALYMKRDAFKHEDEWRALLYCPDAKKPVKGIAVKVEPHELIRSVLLDPRAPQELIDAFRLYFKRKLGFKGEVKRSGLYASPTPIEIEDPDEL